PKSATWARPSASTRRSSTPRSRPAKPTATTTWPRCRRCATWRCAPAAWARASATQRPRAAPAPAAAWAAATELGRKQRRDLRGLAEVFQPQHRVAQLGHAAVRQRSRGELLELGDDLGRGGELLVAAAWCLLCLLELFPAAQMHL